MSKAETAFVGARGVDSEPESHNCDPKQLAALKASGIDFIVLYLGAVSADGVAAILAAGLAFMPCTYADRFDGATTVDQMRALGMPAGCTVWLDIEGLPICPPAIDPQVLIAKVNAWCDAVAAAGFMPGVYIGSPQPLTSAELYALHAVRYWRAPSRVMDRHGQLAEPACAWCMFQAWPSRMWAGVWVDVDFVYEDYRSRLPVWVVAD